MKKGANPRAAAAAVGARPQHVYTRALQGFAGPLNRGQVEALWRRKDVELIEADQVVTAADLHCPDPGPEFPKTTQFKTQSETWPAYSVDHLDRRERELGSYVYTWTGEGVTVYVFDTWMYTAHPDFGGRAKAGYDGYPSQPASGQSCSGHGTHVAGIIGGTKWGVAKKAELVSVEVLDCSGKGSVSTLLDGIEWVRSDQAGKRAVANMSLSTSRSLILNWAVNGLSADGVLVAVAAGNNNANACNYSPASASSVVTTAASNSNDERASFSNYGSCVNVYAGGTNVRSTWSDGGTRTASGTSMATPAVAGVAALYKHARGDAPSSVIKSYIESSATPNLVVNNPSGTPNRLLHWECSGAAED